MIELIHAARTGDKAALDRLMEEIGPYINGQVRQRIDEPGRHRLDLSGVAQDVRLSVIEGIRRFEGSTEKEFFSWLKTIAHRRAVDALRHNRLAPESLDQSRSRGPKERDLLQAASPTPSKAAREGELSDYLHDAIQRLTSEQREVIELKMQGLSWPEIATKLGINENAAHQRHFRAIRELRKFLPPDFFEGHDF